MLLLLACTAPGDVPDGDGDTRDSSGEDTASDDTADSDDTDDTADSDDTGDTDDTDDTADTDVAEQSGVLKTLGLSTVLDAWSGTESFVLTDDDGYGDEVCRVTVTLASVAAREDCELCDWAFELEVTAVEIVTDLACEPIEDVIGEQVIGATRIYGYTPDYLGHAPSLLGWDGAAWVPVTFAYWNPETGAIAYTINGGYFDW